MSFFYGDTKTDELIVGQTSSSNGYIDLYDSGTTNKITLRAPNSITTSYNLTLPSVNGTEDQVITINGVDGNMLFADAAPSSNRVVFQVKNETGDTITQGTPVYFDGISGQNILVAPADASNSSKMPAGGILNETLINNQSGILIEQGKLTNIDMSTYSINDSLYVAVGGGLSNVKPGYPNLIQNIARVTKNDANGSLVVTGPSRTNDVPNLGDSNIWIGKGSGLTTTEYPISGDVTMSNTGVFTINGISNTATISSTANITMDSNQTLTFRNANTSIKSSADSNLSVKVDNTIFNHAGDENYLTISSNSDSSCVSVSFLGKSYNSNSTSPGSDEGKTGGILDILASSGSSNISGQFGFGSGGAININKFGYGLGGNNFNNNAAGTGSSININGGQGGNSYLNTSYGAASSSFATGGSGGSISLYAGTGGSGYDGGDGGNLAFYAGYGGSGSNTSGENGNIIFNSNVKIDGTVKTSFNSNIDFESNISIIGDKKLYFDSNSYINSEFNSLYVKNSDSSGSTYVEGNYVALTETTNFNSVSVGSSGISLSGGSNSVTISGSNINQSLYNVNAYNTMGGQIVYGVDSLSSGGATDGTRVEIKSSSYYNSVKSIIQSTTDDDTIQYFHANSGGQTGEMMHILYYNANVSGSANIDFNTTNLYSGTGANRYLEFDTPGQSATLIWIDNASATIAGWRIINTGGSVGGT